MNAQDRASRPAILACARPGVFFLLALLLAAVPGPENLRAQPRPTDRLMITAAPALVTFHLKPSGIAPGDAPISINTVWEIQRGGTQVSVYAYFANPSGALVGRPNNRIPSSRVFGKVGGNPFRPFTGAGPFSGGSLLIFSTQVRGNKRSSRTDSLALQIDTTGLALQPDVFGGVLRLQAQAF
jgi:hypothetical protein